ncbi:MAG: diguanylate cyclase [Methylomonas sp.]
MLRTQLNSAWLALNLALFIATLAALTVGAFWVISDSESERARQAQHFQRIVSEALDLSKGNPKPLQTLLNSLPGTPIFISLEIQGKSGRVLEARYDTPADWLNTPLPPVSAPLELALDAKGSLTMRLLPAPGFVISRLISFASITLITAGFAFLIVNLAAWLFRKRLKLGPVEETRWTKVMATEAPKSGVPSLADINSHDVLDCLPDAILRCDAHGRATYMNATARILLKPRGDVTENHADLLDLIAPWDRSRCAELLSKTYSSGSRECMETQAVGTSRGILPVSICFTPVPDGSGELVIAVHDASASRAQQEMLEQRDLILDSIPQGLAVLSPEDNGEMLYGNRAFRQLLNMGDTPRYGLWFDRIVSQAPAPLAAQIRSAIDGTSEIAVDLPWRAADENPRTLELRLFPANQGESRLVCELRDRSEETVYRHHAERELFARRMILDQMPVGLCITDDAGRICAANASFAKLTAREPQQLIGTSITDWVPDQPMPQGPLYRGEQAVAQGRVARLNILPLISPEGDKQHAYFFEDITAFKQQAQADGIELDRLQQTLDGIGDGIITTNEDGFIQYINPYAQKLTGLADLQYKGMAFGQVIHLIDEKKREPLVDPAIRAMRIGKTVKFRQDVLFVKANKQELAVEIFANPIFDRKKTVIGAVIVMKDVAEQRSLTQQMQLRASRDPLTGLINRRELLSLLEGLQYEVEERSRQHTLCYMDLDKFKVVNDSCGHNAGDELLRQVSHLMTECLRATDALARIGGDEFCAVLYNTSSENGVIVAEKIREAVKRFRFTWDNKFFEIGVSIGLFDLQPGLNIEETVTAADQACYHAKEAGRDLVYVASPAERGAGKSVLTPWSERLSEALDHDYFRLFRLDTLQLKDNHEKGLAYHEVLLQLHEPNQLPLVASAFMPNAQRLNMGPSIERWVIGKLFSTIGPSALDDAFPEVFAIQLSAVTLADTSFTSFLSEQSKHHAVPAHQICFEIAEDDLVQNFSVVQRFMQEGKKAGYGFCLSRFGGSVSSFAYLRNLPLDFLKIDGSLTHRLDADPVDAVIVRAIQAIGEQMNIRLIAQYEQDQVIREFLSALGVDYMFGPSTGLMPLEPTAKDRKRTH